MPWSSIRGLPHFFFSGVKIYSSLTANLHRVIMSQLIQNIHNLYISCYLIALSKRWIREKRSSTITVGWYDISTVPANYHIFNFRLSMLFSGGRCTATSLGHELQVTFKYNALRRIQIFLLNQKRKNEEITHLIVVSGSPNIFHASSANVKTKKMRLQMCLAVFCKRQISFLGVVQTGPKYLLID